MIQKGRLAVTLFLTRRACEASSRELRNLRLTMFPHEMNDAIGLCLALERAERANERTGFIGMSGGYMEGEGL